MQTKHSTQQMLLMIARYKTISSIARATKLSRQTLYRILEGVQVGTRTEEVIDLFYTRLAAQIHALANLRFIDKSNENK